MPSEEHLHLNPIGTVILEVAAQEAISVYREYLGTEHLLMALSRTAGGYTERMLSRLERPPDILRDVLRERAGRGRSRYFNGFEGVLTPRMRQVLQAAHALAGEGAVGERELLLALLRGGPGIAVRVLTEGEDRTTLEVADLIARVEEDPGPEATELRSRRRHVSPDEEEPADRVRGGSSSTPMLDRYGRDLLAAAHAGKLREAIGRQREMLEVVQALARQDRNVPVLVGDAGVGKTAIVEGLAWRLSRAHERPVNPILEGKRLIALQVADLVAGAGVRGEFEERVQALLRECAQHPEVILFIDEIHTLVGAGHSSSNQDAAQLFKPALANGDLRLIGATTPSEYARYIAKDPALERRMQPVRVEELSPGDTEALLRELAPRYAERHKITIQPEALQAAVTLSVRFLADRHLPDKALDLLDAACASLVVGERISFLGDPAQLLPSDNSRGVVTAETVAAVVARRLHVPIGQITASDRDKLMNLEQALLRRITDQDEAIEAVARALRVARTDLGDNQQRPRGVFLFAGPTGVGKTETARALADVLFGSRQHLLSIGMAEFSQEHMVAELIGSPPGYVGYEQEGRLTGWLQQHPYSIVLFDEFEKAHPAVRKHLLGLFEEGCLTDAKGRTVNGREAIYILTTNWQPGQERRGGISDEPAAAPHPSLDDPYTEAELRRLLGQMMSPELVNRFDRIVLFRPLPYDALLNVASMLLGRIEDRLEARGVTLWVEWDAKKWLVDHGADPSSGARGLARVIDREVLGQIADLDFQGRLRPGSEVRIAVEDNRITVTPKSPGR